MHHEPESSEFSDELAGKRDTQFRRLYAIENRVLTRTRHIAALADLSPLVEGHVLIVPVAYAPAWAVVSREALADWDSLRRRLVPTIERLWGAATLFEHGSVIDMAGGSCITHAHLHVLPLGPSPGLRDRMEVDGLRLFAVSDLRELAEANRPYFWLQEPGKGPVAAWADGPPLGGQYLRRITAKALDISDPEWDWSVVVRRPLLLATVRRLQGSL